jgi:hypothetical protein
MSRRAFLAASAITATSAVTKTAAADALPLGPLPDIFGGPLRNRLFVCGSTSV